MPNPISTNALTSIFGAMNTMNNAQNAGQTVQNNALDGGVNSGMFPGSGNILPTGNNVLSNVLKKGVGAAGKAALDVGTGGAASLALGTLQALVAARKQKKAEEMFPSNEDPELRALANNFARRKRAFQTGTALNSQAANIQALNKQGINAAFRAGGNMAAINRIAQITNQSMLGLNNQALQGEMAFGNQEADVVNRLAQTRLEKALLRYNQANAEAKQAKTTSNRNLMYGLAKTLPIGQVDPTFSTSIPSLSTPGINPNAQNVNNG